jgi:PKD repeat protein
VESITPAAFKILGSTLEPISGLSAINDSPTVLGETTILSATVISGTNVAYKWDLGDGIPGTGALISHIYPNLGVYTATVTASNAVSTAQATTVVEIYEDPIISLKVMNDSPTLIGGTTTLTATVFSGTNVLYDWVLGDGSTATGAVVSHVYPDVGVYIATVTASNAVSTLEASIPIMILPLPPAWHFWLPLMWRGG